MGASMIPVNAWMHLESFSFAFFFFFISREPCLFFSGVYRFPFSVLFY